MKKGIFYTILFVLISLVACTGNTGTHPGDEKSEHTLCVEGIHYLDQKPVSIEIADGKIAKVKTIASESEMPEVYVAPGLIDLQVNGYMGVDFADQNLTMEMIREAVKALWKEGVTSFLPTLTTADHTSLVNSFSIVSKALDDQETGMSVPGFHLEGPYISPVKGFRGAHLEKYIREPDWNEFQELQQAANNGIKIITVAPEIEGAVSFIQKCKQEGIVVSLGHHNGNAREIELATEAGASMSTHLGNGCANMINRHDNPLWPQLANDRLSASLIVDGFHLNQEEVRCFYKIKGNDRTILVSDVLDLAGLEPGVYTRWEREVVLTPDVVKFPAEDVLAGAASSIRACVGNMMRFTGCSLFEAIQMASTNPARLMGYDDLGEIGEGKRADLILFTMENGELVIQQTMVAGKVVYSKK